MQSGFRNFRWVALPLLLLTLVVSSFGADITARIRGTVTDQNGAVVPNAAVTAKNQQTGVTFQTTSQASGGYQFLQLPVGTYAVSATAPGFQKYTATGITLVIDQNYVQDIHFKVGQASDVVEVQANAVQVDTTNIQHSDVLSGQQIVDLPLIGRNFTNLEQVFPGVQASNDRFGTYSANGSQTQQTSFLVNGTDVNDAPLNTAIVIPSPDAVQEFNLITSSLNPEYSRNSGAIVSVNIKNGTNQFHGGAFDFYRDTFLNSPNWFQSKCHTISPVTGLCTGPGASKFHQNFYGGTLGGPVMKDKAFFFLSYQAQRATQPQTVGVNTVFTAAQRNGDFSAFNFSKTKKVPGTIAPSLPLCSAGEFWNACAAAYGKIFPTAAFNPISAALLAKYVPLPNTSTNQFSFNPTTQTRQEQGIMRYDINPTQNNRFWFTGIFQHSPSSDTLPFTGSTLPGFGENAQRDTHLFTADWTHTFNPTTLNDFRVGFTRFNFAAVLPNEKIDPKSLGFAINTQEPKYLQVPRISVSGFFNLGFSSNGPQPRIDQNYQISDNFSKVLGNHTLKFGFDGRKFDVNNPFYANLNGTYSFSSSGFYSTGNAGVDFLLGDTRSYIQGSGETIRAHAYESYVYGQDQWKVLPNLTLTYGAGWQVDSPWHNTQFKGQGVTCFLPGQQSKVFPTAPTSLDYPGDPGCTNTQGARNSWKHVGPRVGFAWAPSLGWLSGGESHKLSIRGGYGIYFNRTEEEGSLQNLLDPPFALSSLGANDFGARAPGFANPYQDLNTGVVNQNKFPFTPVLPPGAGYDFTGSEPFSLSQYAPTYTMPYSQNFNLTIERELPSNIVATVSYVGSLGRKEQVTVEGNPITPAGHAACLADPTCATDVDFVGLDFPQYTQFGNGDVFSSIGTIDSRGKSSYNALQVSAKKGFTHGLQFQASYTWSHSLDDASGFESAGFGNARGYNQYQPSLNYGDSDFDARHRFVFAPVYMAPNWNKAPGLHWLPDVIGKGWGFSGAMTFATGFPFDFSYQGGIGNSLYCSSIFSYYGCPDVPDQLTALKRIDPRNTKNTIASGKSFWFDPTGLLGDETVGQFGNAHRNSYHGPGINNTDLAILKNIYFWPSHESMYMQLRLESYNVFNHTQFNNPISNPLNGATFGQITTAKAGRQSQLGLKIYF